MTRALLALEFFIDYFTMIIHESDFPLLHRCLLDKTHGWAYTYLDLGRRAMFRRVFRFRYAHFLVGPQWPR
ncbi:hypothetical protein D3C84_1170670 [compost metagenome]